MKKPTKIRASEASQYSADGYFVVQNISIAHVQVSEDGLHVKAGETMAIPACDAQCAKVAERGLVKILARPQGEDSSKKGKKRPDEAPAATQQPESAPVTEEVAISVPNQVVEPIKAEESVAATESASQADQEIPEIA